LRRQARRAKRQSRTLHFESLEYRKMLAVPTYEIGKIPSRIETDGEPVQFIIADAGGLENDIEIAVSPQPQGNLTFDQSTGLFSYVPHASDRFDLAVRITEGNGGTWEVPTAQEFILAPSSAVAEFDILTSIGEKPDKANRDYLDEIVTTRHYQQPILFNGDNKSTTREVHISGITVNLIPGDPNGLFERYGYSDANALINSEIENLTIAAETLVIGGRLRLPKTNVTIFARNLEFRDSPNVVAQIDTTPLPHLRVADAARDGQRGKDGIKGEKGGDVTLHVDAIKIPDGNSIRFVLRGSKGQTAGQGIAGSKGQSYTAYGINGVGNAVAITINGILVNGVRAWPGDGGNATPGGTPGNGGNGGRLFHRSNLQLDQYVDAAGGPAGSKASNQPGGLGGDPRPARWVNYEVRTGRTTITAEHTSSNGQGWTAPSGATGNIGGTSRMDPQNLDWLHPTALSAVVAHIKEAYKRGQVEYAVGILLDYEQLLSQVPAGHAYANRVAEIGNEISVLLNQVANDLDYWGKLAGWVPTLSFAANYQAFQNQIESDLRVLFLSQLIQKIFERGEAREAAIRDTLNELDQQIHIAADRYNSSQFALSGLQTQLESIQRQSDAVLLEIAAVEGRLAARARNNAEGPQWKRALTVAASVARFCTHSSRSSNRSYRSICPGFR